MFTNTPPWALAFGAIGAAAFSTRVSGYLPLTRRASKRITLLRWSFAALIPVGVLFWVGSTITAPSASAGDSTASALIALFFLLGLVAFLVAMVGLVVGRSWFGPRARIKEIRGAPERLIELRNVHPAFVAAVQQLQAQRAAQLQAAQRVAPAPPPESPFPPGKFSF